MAALLSYRLAVLTAVFTAMSVQAYNILNILMMPFAPQQNPNLFRQELLTEGTCQDGGKGGQAGLCSFANGPFHIVCGSFNISQAADVCKLYGWQLAPVTDQDAGWAVQTFQECQAEFAWTAAVNGFSRNPCQGMTAGGIISWRDAYCEFYGSVLCKDVPVVETDTITSTTSTTVASGTTTTTQTTTFKPLCGVDKQLQQQKGKGHALLQRPDKKRAVKQECNTCSDVCKVPRSNFRVLRRNTTYARAAEECAKYGWDLADVTDGATSIYLDAIEACNLRSYAYIPPPNILFWVRSYDGVSAGYAMAAGLVFTRSATGVFYNKQDLQFLDQLAAVYPLCQCDGPRVTGLGPYVGESTSTTTTSVLTVSVYTPAATATVTKTCRL